MPPSRSPTSSRRASGWKFSALGLSRLLLLCLSLFFSPVVSGLVNVTVDDQLGDRTTGLIPEYLPNDGTWHVGSPTEDCSTCKIKPSTFDLSQIHEQTWHDATYSPPLTPATVTVHFTGSAVYVFNILPNTLSNTTTFVNISFTIDGEDVATFTRSPDSSSTILYNQLIYRNVTLEDGPHTLVMAAGGASKSLFLFDYLLYTTQGNDSTSTSTAQLPLSSIPASTSTPASEFSQSPTSSSSKPIGAIVGGVVGGVVILLGLAVVAFLMRRRAMRPDSIRIEAGISPRTRGGPSESDGFLVHPFISTSEFASPSEPSTMRSLSDAAPLGARNPYALPAASDASGPAHTYYTHAAHPPLVARIVSPSGESGEAPSTATRTDQWSSKRRAELTRRLESLQRTRSMLSSESPPYGQASARSEVSSGGGSGGTEQAVRELEAEIAELRGVLATLSARLADGSQARGPRESLPAYVE